MADPTGFSETGQKTGLPRWVKVQGIVLLLYLLIVIAMPTGLIGPGLFGLDTGGRGGSGWGHAPPPGGH